MRGECVSPDEVQRWSGERWRREVGGGHMLLRELIEATRVQCFREGERQRKGGIEFLVTGKVSQERKSCPCVLPVSSPFQHPIHPSPSSSLFPRLLHYLLTHLVISFLSSCFFLPDQAEVLVPEESEGLTSQSVCCWLTD